MSLFLTDDSNMPVLRGLFAVVEPCHQGREVDDGEWAVAQRGALGVNGHYASQGADGDAEHRHHQAAGYDDLVASHDDVVLEVFNLECGNDRAYEESLAHHAYGGDIRA